ncbi:MAG: hypothetical protein U5J83_00760 [Bryobacterales bacterium]|nr:hypothetical protein [Bryobacterales bacterium]
MSRASAGVSDVEFSYAAQLRHTIRLLCVARLSPGGLALSVRPALLPKSAIPAKREWLLQCHLGQGCRRCRYLRPRSRRGSAADGRGGGERPCSPPAAVAERSADRVSPCSFRQLAQHRPAPPESFKQPYYLCFRVENRFGIIADLATICGITASGIDAVGQLPITNWLAPSSPVSHGGTGVHDGDRSRGAGGN